MNIDRRWSGRSAILIRPWAAGLMLSLAGCVVLGFGSRARQAAVKPGDQVSDRRISNEQFRPGVAMASPLARIHQAEGSGPGSTSQTRGVFPGLPLRFEPNQGQANLDPTDRRVRFLARGPQYSVFLGSEGAILQLFSHHSSKRDAPPSATHMESLEMKLTGAAPNPSLSGADLLPGKSNYILGNDPARWRQGIPQFARVRYADIYPGIDLVFYGNQGRLEYDFRVRPGSDPTQAELDFDGARQLELRDGALVIRAREGSVRLEAPRVYQQIAGRERAVAASFVLRGAKRAGFAIGAYDHSRELVIDPVLTFSTYFGASGDEQSSSVAVDGAGNIYLAGSTNSIDLPVTAGVVQGKLGGSGATNVYIAKITPPLGTSSAMVDYVTYLGGSGVDYPVGIGVDGAGDAYVAGTTTSKDFPTSIQAYQGPSQLENPGAPHVFVTKLNPTATAPPLYSSYLSGNGNDIATGMTIDAKADIYVTGTTTSVTATGDQFPASNLPEALPFQSTSRAAAGIPQFYVTKVYTDAPGIGSIPYSTYFGGGTFVPPPLPAPQVPIVTGGGIAVDANGNIYFTGTTNFTYTGSSPTTDFPILNAYQPCLDQAPPTTITNPPTCSNTSSTANSDAFVAKLNPNALQGSQLLWSTYVGGSQSDTGAGIALDSGAANVYVTGSTNSQDFTASTFASYQKCLNNLFTGTGTAITCTTQTTPAPYDAFVARLSNPATSTTGTPTPVSLTYFSYLGGANDENGLAIAVDAAGGALLTGWTKSPVLNTPPASGDFPVLNCADIQCSLNPTQDAFVARVNTAAGTGQSQTASWASYFGGMGIGQGTSITLDVNQIAYFAGDTNSTDLEQLGRLVKPLQSQNMGGYDAILAQVGAAANLSISGVLSLGTSQYISAGSNATFTYTVTNNGPDLATGIIVTDNLSPSVTGVPLTFVSAGVSVNSGSCSGGSATTNVVCNVGSLQAGSDAIITVTVTPKSTGGPATFNGGSVVATAANGINSAPLSVPGQISDYSMSVSPSSFSVPAAGDTAIYSVQLNPLPVYATNISLTCSGNPMPPGVACTFVPNPVSLPSVSPQPSALNITTQTRPPVTPAASLWTRRLYALWFGIPGLALIGMVGGDRRRRRMAGLLLLCALLSLLLQPACGHTTTQPPVSGTPAGTYSITVTATAGSDTKSATVQLVVP